MPENLPEILTKRFGKLGWPQSKKRTLPASPDLGVWRRILRFQILVFSVPAYPNSHFFIPISTLLCILHPRDEKANSHD
jgi:hypothetical protein